MKIKFGPAGLGGVKEAEENLEAFYRAGLRVCEIAFTYSVYIKEEGDAVWIGAKARELGIELTVHAPYFVNLNSDDAEKREASKKRILECCRVGELMGATLVVFHPGFYGKDREGAYDRIKEGIVEMMEVIEKKGWGIKLAPETMGKVNVFGNVEEISKLVEDTGCGFCIDFSHILARDKEIDMERIERAFPWKEWHCHFSGIEYGEKGEKHHKMSEKENWRELLKKLPEDREITIVCEDPDPPAGAVLGLETYEEMGKS